MKKVTEKSNDCTKRKLRFLTRVGYAKAQSFRHEKFENRTSNSIESAEFESFDHGKSKIIPSNVASWHTITNVNQGNVFTNCKLTLQGGKVLSIELKFPDKIIIIGCSGVDPGMCYTFIVFLQNHPGQLI